MRHPLVDAGTHRFRLTRELLDATDGKPVCRKPPRHILEQRPQPTHVGMQHQPSRWHPIRPCMHSRNIKPVNAKNAMLDGDLLPTFS